MKITHNISQTLNLPLEEKKILEWWVSDKTFERSVDSRSPQNEFIFYDGPPFANGMPHYGHLLTSCAKDTIARFKTMRGHQVRRVFGWDCHGLPAEMGAEKTLDITGRKAIIEYGIDKFNAHCGATVMKYTREWATYMSRIGRWVDMENAYKTMDKNFMESVLWAFKTLWTKGLVYEDLRVMPYSWACQTPLSNFETRLDNSYREKVSKTVIAKFTLKSLPKVLADLVFEGAAQQGLDVEDEGTQKGLKVQILAWTTTPWTLPSNLALAVNKDIEYDYGKRGSTILIGAGLGNFGTDIEILGSIKGTELVGLDYVPLFPYFVATASPASFKVYHEDFVTLGEGTGIVHIAPGFGEDDFELAKKHKIGVYVDIGAEACSSKSEIQAPVPVDDAGKFTSEVGDFVGRLVLETNDDVIKALKNSDNWFKTDQHIHNYPFCWRTDEPIIFRAMPSIYVKVSEFRELLVELNKEINWIPESTGSNLFGNWLREAKDWSISRNRFWGTPIPLWRSDDPKYPYEVAFGSIAELEAFFGAHYKSEFGTDLKIDDLHLPFIDKMRAPNPKDPTGRSMLRRVSGVFDCWFESGCVPFAEMHYPFENTGDVKAQDQDVRLKVQSEGSDLPLPPRIPGDFVVEYTAQTRGWFYTLTVLSALLFKKIPFKNCICHGVVLDENGQKLSKRLNNYVDPLESMDQYGADVLRYTMLSSAVMSGGELKINKDGSDFDAAYKSTFRPLWSALYFLTLYAKADEATLTRVEARDVLGGYDLFIVLRATEFMIGVQEALESYQISAAYKLIGDFVDDLNNLYIRRNRSRFWGRAGQAKDSAYNALYTALCYFVLAAAPLLPYFTEVMHKALGFQDSVHLELLPTTPEFLANFKSLQARNGNFLSAMQLLKTIFSAGRSIREEKIKIRIRQPLQTLRLISNIDLAEHHDFLVSEIKSELNVKSVEFLTEAKGQAGGFFAKILRLQESILGRKYKTKFPEIKRDTAAGKYTMINGGLSIAGITLEPDEFFWQIQINPEFLEASQVAYQKEGEFIIVGYDSAVTPELAEEGMVRDLVRSIQNARRTQLNVEDRIELHILSRDPDLTRACDKFANFIKSETLAKVMHVHLYNDYAAIKDIEENLAQKNAIFGSAVQNSLTGKNVECRLSYSKF